MIDMTWLLRLPPAQQQVYFQGPALKPPPGVKPNFTDPPNQNVMGYIILIICAVIVAVLVTLQLYSRIFYHKKFAIEDGEWSYLHNAMTLLIQSGVTVAALVYFSNPKSDF